MSFIETYTPWIAAIGGIIGAILAIATPIFRKTGQLMEQQHEADKRLLQLETRFNVFWSAIEKELPKVLLRPHTPEIDKYLRKMQHGVLTDDDKREMTRLLREVLDKGVDDEHDKDNNLKFAYAFLIARFESELAAKDRLDAVQDRLIKKGIWKW